MVESKSSESGGSRTQAGQFEKTLWSVVFRAGHAGSPERTAALEQLCRSYWYPTYAFLRRWGYDQEAAKDLTQGFFAHFLAKDIFSEANPENGRFRSFLLASLKNFLRNEERREHAQKRGGQAELLSLDAELAEGRYALEPIDAMTPERLFERRWAWEVLRQAMQGLEDEYRRAGGVEEFLALRPCLTGSAELDYTELSTRVHRNEGALRTAVCRLRLQFRNAIRQVVADTVADSAQVDDELQQLKAILRNE